MRTRKTLFRPESLVLALVSAVAALIYNSMAMAATPAGTHYVTMSERIGKLIVLVRSFDVWIYFFQGILLFVGVGFTIYYLIVFYQKGFLAKLKSKTAELTQSADLQQAIDWEIESLSNRFLFLDLMIGGAPVAGLLGTVVGLVQVFSEQTLVENVTMQTIASGMYVAMVTTVCGLIVALIGIIGRHLLEARLAELRDMLSGAR